MLRTISDAEQALASWLEDVVAGRAGEPPHGDALAGAGAVLATLRLGPWCDAPRPGSVVRLRPGSGSSVSSADGFLHAMTCAVDDVPSNESAVVLCGTVASLVRAGRAGVRPSFALVEGAATSAGVREASGALRCGVGRVVFDGAGVPLLLSRDEASALRWVRSGWFLADRFGQPVPVGGWGGAVRRNAPFEPGPRLERVLDEAGEGGRHAGFEPGNPLRMGDGQICDLPELHGTMSALGVAAYAFRQDPNGLMRLHFAPPSGVDADDLRERVAEVAGQAFEVELVVEEAATELLPPIAIDRKPPPEVFVFHAPDAEHAASTDAVREVLRLSGVAAGTAIDLQFVGEDEESWFEVITHAALALGAHLERDGAFKLVFALRPPAAGEGPHADAFVLRARLPSGGLIVGGRDREAIGRVVCALSGAPGGDLSRVLLFGVQPESATRPLVVRAPPAAGTVEPIAVDKALCNGCGDCVEVCPADCISLSSGAPVIDADRCVRCHLCGEACESGALRPYANEGALLAGVRLERQVPLLVQLGRPKEPRPTPAWNPRVRRPDRPPVVLGLATVTLMEHAAALMIGDEIVAVVEEERLARERHYTWRSPDKPGSSLASDPTLPLDASWPRRAIDAVLQMAKLTLDDVDAIAINGMPSRMRHSFSSEGLLRKPRISRAGRLYFVPHHMCNAASVLGVSDFEDGWILTVDGRGDRETGSLWRVEGNDLEPVDLVPFFPDRSFGGVFETLTRVLGFGSHGQGSTMALAALGEANVDLSSCLSMKDGTLHLSEWDAWHRFKHLARERSGPLSKAHENLAASAQQALEETVLALLERGLGGEHPKRLGLGGGVALNCRMNGVIRRRFPGVEMAVPPGANDAGAAVGAAILAHRALTGELVRPNLGHAYLGPAWSDEAIARTLQRAGVPFEALSSVEERTAELLASGAIVCWFQGRMEYGPRALGGRSILADPRRADLKARLNAMKSREPWRPFGPSILAGHQGEWFEDDWDSRFMLFAVQVKVDRRERVPVITHLDGSTRPQVVHPEHAPRYHELISAFHRRTGVPMVVNTSFNRGGEPIVMTPLDALKSFAGLGADALVLGNCLVTREGLARRSR